MGITEEIWKKHDAYIAGCYTPGDAAGFALAF